MGSMCSRGYWGSPGDFGENQLEDDKSPSVLQPPADDMYDSFNKLDKQNFQADECSTMAMHMDDEDLESEDNDDDVVEDLPAPPPSTWKKPRNSVSAEAYGEWNKRRFFKPPIHRKTEEQKKKIAEVIGESFLFSALDGREMETIIDAFEEQNIKKDVYIIHQGEDGDKLYLIESGEVDVYKKLPGKETDDFMCKMVEGDTFGELALMYNAPRAASVKATTDMHLWALDRETFNCIVKNAAAKKRETYEKYLKEVPLLKDMIEYERSKVADALRKEWFSDESVIIKEGEAGNNFYILIEGEAEALKEGKVVMNYKRGDYFGELALLKDQPRAATVKAKGDCQVVSLNRRSFKRLLGPVEQILKRNLENYKNVCKSLGLDTKYLEK